MQSYLFRLQGPKNRSSNAELGALVVKTLILPLYPNFDWNDLEALVSTDPVRFAGWFTDLKKSTWNIGKKASNLWTFGTGETILNSLQSFVNGVTSKSQKITEAGETAQSLLASIGALFRAEKATGAPSFILKNRIWILIGGGLVGVYLIKKIF